MSGNKIIYINRILICFTKVSVPSPQPELKRKEQKKMPFSKGILSVQYMTTEYVKEDSVQVRLSILCSTDFRVYKSNLRVLA